MKPSCKSEARWLFWRYERPRQNEDESFRPYKTLMAQARRRFAKKEIQKEIDDLN